ncbi:MAG: cytochrome c biogenesis protein CcsA [Chloroflexi bacterium]|nr:cytochrome c biogenesis protein CcsA [Chloroflexota bacterium]
MTMLPDIGAALVGFAAITTLYGVGAMALYLRRSDTRYAYSGRNATCAGAVLLWSAVGLLLLAFVTDRFQIQYVAEHSSRDLPLYLKVSALWGGQEGSLLLWCALQALFAALVARGIVGKGDRTTAWATTFLSVITAFFCIITFSQSNPFVLSVVTPHDGAGLNPLLRHIAMVIHPPAMYVGYVGLSVPFALALAALLTGRLDEWPRIARGWLLVAWVFLGVGLLLGARWAYDVLGWGGYWGWDPVENAGLMPWLTSTALLHGLVMQNERRGFRSWNVVLATSSFVLVLFGTFVTRSGLIVSVHAFARSTIGGYFLAFIGLVVAATVGIAWIRRDGFSERRQPVGLISRDGVFFLTLVLLAAVTLSILIGSLLPTLTVWISGQRFEAGPDWFDQVTGPQFAALLALLGVCPLLGRAGLQIRARRSRGWFLIAGPVILVGAALASGFGDPVGLAGLALAGLAGATALAELARGITEWIRRSGETISAAWRHMFWLHGRQYGGYLVHIGVVLLACGVIGTRMAPFETSVVTSRGVPVEVGGYELTFIGTNQRMAADRFETRAAIEVNRAGRHVGVLQPIVAQYAPSDQSYATPAVRSSVREDLYLVLVGWDTSGHSVTLRVFVNRLAGFLWAGGILVLLGGCVSGLTLPQSADEGILRCVPRRMRDATGLALIVLVFAALVLLVWTPETGGTQRGLLTGAVASRGASRLQVGDIAPDFSLTLLDGARLASSGLEVEAVVLNFWGTWCGPCVDELAELQSIWEEYGARGVVVVGAAVADEEESVRRLIARRRVTYPVALDVSGHLSEDYGITGVPETFVVAGDDTVAAVFVGPLTREQLVDELERLVGD